MPNDFVSLTLQDAPRKLGGFNTCLRIWLDYQIQQS